MNDFNICVPVINQHDSTLETLRSFTDKADDPTSFKWIFIDNGSNPPLTEILEEHSTEFGNVIVYVRRNLENLGVTEALNQGWLNSVRVPILNCKYLFYTHNDVLIEEKSWDTKLRNFLNTLPKVGVAGFGGATGLGSPDIYKVPYNIWQLARTDFVSNMRNSEVHGRVLTKPYEEVAVLDGFSLIVNVELLNLVKGFDTENYPIHHNYDNDICLEALRHGYKNYVLNIKSHHKGGITSTREDYANWVAPIGGDSEVHRHAHETFYRKWEGFLPVRVVKVG